MNCTRCNFYAKSTGSFSKHMGMKHKLTKDEVIDELFEIKPDLFMTCLHCKKKFKKLIKKAGRRTCSDKCMNDYKPIGNKGRKQSKETIRKRILATDQNEKERKRQKTLMERYGKNYHYNDPKLRSKRISESHKGKKHSKEHHVKVIETKRKNGTLNHTENTRRLLSEKLLKYNQTGDDQSIHLNKNTSTYNGKGYKVGTFEGMSYRSSYELLFLQFCSKNNIVVRSAENKEFRVRYIVDGKKRWYYPDFFLEKTNTVVEIKPSKLLKHGNNPAKFEAAKKRYDRFVIITEMELINDETMLTLIYLQSG